MEEIRPQRPNSYLALAIISTIICCLPAGVVSIVYATQVNSAYEDGNYAKAQSASKNAKTWGIVSIVAAAAFWLLYIIIFGLAFIGAAANGGY